MEFGSPQYYRILAFVTVILIAQLVVLIRTSILRGRRPLRDIGSAQMETEDFRSVPLPVNDGRHDLSSTPPPGASAPLCAVASNGGAAANVPVTLTGHMLPPHDEPMDEPVPAAGKPTEEAPRARTALDWNHLLTRARQRRDETRFGTGFTSLVEVREDVLDAIIRGVPISKSEIRIPKGFHDGSVLASLLKTKPVINGLLVSLFVGPPSDSAPAAPTPDNAITLIRTLMDPNGFGCRASAGDFVLFYPRERGISAQRRLSRIAKTLWDFQLRSPQGHSTMFHWGAIEASDEPLDEVYAAASERMMEAKRVRQQFIGTAVHHKAL